MPRSAGRRKLRILRYYAPRSRRREGKSHVYTKASCRLRSKRLICLSVYIHTYLHCLREYRATRISRFLSSFLSLSPSLPPSLPSSLSFSLSLSCGQLNDLHRGSQESVSETGYRFSPKSPESGRAYVKVTCANSCTSGRCELGEFGGGQRWSSRRGSARVFAHPRSTRSPRVETANLKFSPSLTLFPARDGKIDSTVTSTWELHTRRTKARLTVRRMQGRTSRWTNIQIDPAVKSLRRESITVT